MGLLVRQGAAPKGAPNKKRNRIQRSHVLFAWSFILIPLLYLIIQWVFINGQTILLAFKSPTNTWTFDNFVDVWERFTDPYEADMLPLVLNTLTYFAIQEFLGLPVSFFISYFIYKKIPGHKFFRVVFYLPQILPAMVLITATKQFVAPGGVFEAICAAVGIHLPEEGLLAYGETAKWTLIAYTFLTASCGNILFYSAMSRIPPDLIDAGKIDGLTPFQEFINIVFPLILPTFMMTLLLDSCSILNAGPPVFLFGNIPGTNNIANWFFYSVYAGNVNMIGEYGFLSALGLCFTLLNLPIVFTIRHLADKFATVEY